MNTHHVPRSKRHRFAAWFLATLATSMLLIVGLNGCGSGVAPAISTESEGATPAADPIGERLFLDTRFAKFFYLTMTSVNAPLATGDPVVDSVSTPVGNLPGPFKGNAINCRSCHFVTEFQGVAGVGNRTYSDFSAHSKLPVTLNRFSVTPRNAMQMVGSIRTDGGLQFLHFDGEFASAQDLVRGTLTGRMLGWNPQDTQTAIHHVANVIRGDDGSDQLAADRSNGLSYGTLFLGTDPRITPDILLPTSQRIDVKTASDEQILDEVALCIAQYFADLQFKQDGYGRYVASPYDLFLQKNHLPRQPLRGESSAAYNQRLLTDVQALSSPRWVTPADGTFAYHDQPFQFGATELAGLKIFLTIGDAGTTAHAGNCAACHAAPNFTDYGLHNSGVSQDEYDSVHGTGSFLSLFVPTQAERMANYDLYLPVSQAHPNAGENFRRSPEAGYPEAADLGAWNVYMNTDIPKPQNNLRSYICAAGKDCSVDGGLPNSIALFKTPMLRDLVDSAPYFHNGAAKTFDQVVAHYIKFSAMARQGKMRNAPPEFANMALTAEDSDALVAFLLSLTEDYDDA